MSLFVAVTVRVDGTHDNPRPVSGERDDAAGNARAESSMIAVVIGAMHELGGAHSTAVKCPGVEPAVRAAPHPERQP
jgi:hypothetical protein